VRVNGNGEVELGKGGTRGSMWDEVGEWWELWLEGGSDCGLGLGWRWRVE